MIPRIKPVTPLTPSGGVHTSTGANSNLRFPGQWFQSESALHQNWMRDYDPTTGRYIQADPLGLVPGPSLYGYAYQSPMMYIDPDGENPWLVGAAIGLGLGLLEQYFQHGLDYECYDWAGIGISTALGAAGSGWGWRMAGAAGPGKVFSHAIPARAKKWPGLGGRFGKWLLKGGRNGNKYNGNFVSKKRHYKHDPAYFGHERGDGLLRRGEWGKRFWRPIQQADRIPWFYRGAIPGGASGLTYDLMGCGCSE